MNIDNITSESMTLTNDGKSMQIKVYEELIDELQSNWNSLREWLEENYKDTQDIWYVKIINKMNELEGGDK